MPRVPLVERDDLAEVDRAVFDRLEQAGTALGDLPRVLAHVPAASGAVVSLMASLYEGELDPRLRELAVLIVAHETGARYVADRHWNYGLRAGVPREQLQEVASFETSSLYDAQERAVMRYAREATTSVEVAAGTWDELRRFLDARRAVELALVVGFYVMLARIVVPLHIETEPWYERG